LLDHDTIRLVAELGDVATRSQAAAALASRLGADDLLVFVEDAGKETFAPACGSSHRIASGSSWHEFLRCCHASAVHCGTVAHPSSETPVPAVGCRAPGVLLVFLGEGLEPQRLDAIRPILPLLAAALRAERALSMARAEHPGWPDEGFLELLGHEFRNHLTPISTITFMLQRKGESRRELDILERQTAHLLRLVNDVLDASRLVRGKTELFKERFELATVAARAVETTSHLLAEKHQSLNVDIPGDGLELNADAARLTQVFSNLLSNAARYSDENTSITISATRCGERVAVRVKDQGIGIGPDMLEVIFDNFLGQRNDCSQGGLGLGLAIVRSLVGLHGGTVRALSDGPGKGSEFLVELPLATADGASGPTR
jgi:signal transduction histidine kinase